MRQGKFPRGTPENFTGELLRRPTRIISPGKEDFTGELIGVNARRVTSPGKIRQRSIITEIARALRLLARYVYVYAACSVAGKYYFYG